MKHMSLSIATALLSSCASFESGSSRVVVSSHKPPLGCKSIGNVAGSSLNAMKNHAHQLGANYILIPSHANQSVGKAYVCVPSKIGL